MADSAFPGEEDGVRLHDLIDEILDRHHLRLHRQIPVLDAALRDEGGSPALLEAWTELATLLGEHLAKEEGILFPAVRRLEAEGVDFMCGFEGPLAQMAYEHRRIDHLIARLRAEAGSTGPSRDDLLDLLDDLEVHARREDDELFPAVAALAERCA